MAHDEAIQHALELIKAGNKEEARSVLQDLLRRDRDNLAGWQGMARLAMDRQEAAFCLKQILRLKPGDAWASQQIEKLEAKAAEPEPPPEPASPEPAAPEPPADSGLPPLMRSEPPAESGLPDFMQAAPPADSGLPPLMSSEPPAESGLPDFIQAAPPADSGLPPLMSSEPPAESGLPDFMQAAPPADSGLPPLMRSAPPAESGLPDFIQPEKPPEGLSAFPPLMSFDAPTQAAPQNRTHPTPMEALPSISGSADEWREAHAGTVDEAPGAESGEPEMPGEDWRESLYEKPAEEEPESKRGRRRKKRDKSTPEEAVEGEEKGISCWLIGGLLLILLCVIMGMAYVLIPKGNLPFDVSNVSVPTGGGDGGSVVDEIDDFYDTTYTGNIGLGQSQQQTLEGAFDAHTWLFEGSAGQSITISVAGVGDMDPEVYLYDSGGNVLGYDDDGGGGHDALLTHTLPAGGTYVIRVHPWQVGTYTIRVD